jgi:hypothetical protein
MRFKNNQEQDVLALCWTYQHAVLMGAESINHRAESIGVTPRGHKSHSKQESWPLPLNLLKVHSQNQRDQFTLRLASTHPCFVGATRVLYAFHRVRRCILGVL